jgi:hypothetical protein
VAKATKNKKNNKEGRHVGLDFYDLLIEALKFRLLSIQFTSEGFETGRKISVMGMLRYLDVAFWQAQNHLGS